MKKIEMNDLTFTVNKIVIKGNTFGLILIQPPSRYPADPWTAENQQRIRAMGWRIPYPHLIQTPPNLTPEDQFTLTVSFAEGGILHNQPAIGRTEIEGAFACTFDSKKVSCGPL